ncbi:MAG TPA: hypothetical protein VFA12_20590 [Stellaceae bacterium]|nr:hypothetical protein [Stellaceae bacterium]
MTRDEIISREIAHMLRREGSGRIRPQTTKQLFLAAALGGDDTVFAMPMRDAAAPAASSSLA